MYFYLLQACKSIVKRGRPLGRPLGGHCGGHWEATGRPLGGHWAAAVHCPHAQTHTLRRTRTHTQAYARCTYMFKKVGVLSVAVLARGSVEPRCRASPRWRSVRTSQPSVSAPKHRRHHRRRKCLWRRHPRSALRTRAPGKWCTWSLPRTRGRREAPAAPTAAALRLLFC